MFTNKDIEYRSIVLINALDGKSLRVRNGELLLENVKEGKILTKLPFQKILALFILGETTLTSALIAKCAQFGVALVVMKSNFRPVFFAFPIAEANFLLRQKQYLFNSEDITIARRIVENKIDNQIIVLKRIRSKSEVVKYALQNCIKCRESLPSALDYHMLLGIEGVAAKAMFRGLFDEFEWKGRFPRTKLDTLNVTLDIGYTVLFNFVEVFLRLFGFDLYMGVYHRLWFRRKSLVCDVMEPLRPIIDYGIRKAFKTKVFSPSDFEFLQHQYFLKREKIPLYMKYFFALLLPYKSECFGFIREYYRRFMKGSLSIDYKSFKLK